MRVAKRPLAEAVALISRDHDLSPRKARLLLRAALREQARRTADPEDLSRNEEIARTDTAPASQPDRAQLSREWDSLTPAAQAAIAALGNGRLDAVIELLESGEPLPPWFRRLLAAAMRADGNTDYAMTIGQRRKTGAPPPPWLDWRGILMAEEVERRKLAGEQVKAAISAVAARWKVSESTVKATARRYREDKKPPQ